VSAPAVSVALPVYRDDGLLEHALACISRQSLRDLEVLIVLNGADPATAARARSLAAAEHRARIIELPQANLAAALNVALESARAPLVARMDADDLCPAARLALQAARMTAQPSLAALGCAWEVISSPGTVLATIRPPTEPAEARWRLLLGNPFAHGSMMLRKDAILAAGAYDTRCTRAQDFDLWLRLSQRAAMAALPEVLYQHRTRLPQDHSGSTPEQAAFAADALVRAWGRLPPGDDHPIARSLAGALERGARPGEALSELEASLRQAPSRAALTAWLYTQWATSPAPRRALEFCRLARLREVGAQVRSNGIGSVWLWGAGEHTRWLLDHRADLGLTVAGLVDDDRAGIERFGFPVQSPHAIAPGQTAILSSDWHEDAMWIAAAPHRARGVNIVRLYAA
jgi:hypothetical protein